MLRYSSHHRPYEPPYEEEDSFTSVSSTSVHITSVNRATDINTTTDSTTNVRVSHRDTLDEPARLLVLAHRSSLALFSQGAVPRVSLYCIIIIIIFKIQQQAC